MLHQSGAGVPTSCPSATPSPQGPRSLIVGCAGLWRCLVCKPRGAMPPPRPPVAIAPGVAEHVNSRVACKNSAAFPVSREVARLRVTRRPTIRQLPPLNYLAAKVSCCRATAISRRGRPRCTPTTLLEHKCRSGSDRTRPTSELASPTESSFMLTRRTFLQSSAVVAGGLLLPWRGRSVLAAIPGGTLPPGSVAKYVAPLIAPPPMPRTSRLRSADGQWSAPSCGL